jgi:hypothetical protein
MERIMSHVVEVRHIGLDHGAAKDELQHWLDQQDIQPMLFEHSTGGPGITFRVYFAMEDEAVAFAETFDGWLDDGREPRNGDRWNVGNIAARRTNPTAASPLDKSRHRADTASSKPAESRQEA